MRVDAGKKRPINQDNLGTYIDKASNTGEQDDISVVVLTVHSQQSTPRILL